MAIRLKVLDGCPVRLKTGPDETVLLQTGDGYPIYPEPYTGEYEITPTESEIGLQTNGLMMTSDVTVHGIPTDYVGSAIDRRDSSDISVSGPNVSIPGGYYEESASASVSSGSAAVPSLNIEKNPTISVSSGGLITATVSTSETVSPVITAGYVDSGSSGTISFSGTATQQLTVKSSSDLSISGPTVTTPAGFYADNASATVSSGNIGNPNVVRSKDASYFYETISYPNFHEGYITSAPSLQTHFALEDKTVTPSTTAQTVGPTGDSYYLNSVTVSAVTSGSAGTPTATKGTVTNHSVTVTPSVTNTTGYINGGTINGTAVTVTASELVSGSQTLTANNTYDVTNLAEVVVLVDDAPTLQTKTNINPTLSSQTITADEGYDGLYSVQINAMPSGTAGTPSASKGAVNNHSITVTPSVTNATGYITGGTINGTAVTVSASELVSGTYSVTSAGTANVTNYASVSVPSGTAGTPSASKGAVTNHAITVTPSVTNSAGFISSGSISGTAVTVSASELVSGTYNVSTSGTADVTNYASISVPAGSTGTPSAAKGAVSDHSITVTPSVTNSTGFVNGGSLTGTAVTVSASELVSGTLSITTNTTYDVTNYQYANVNVAGIDISDTTLTADKALAGYYFYTAQGVKTEGTIVDGNNIGYGITDGTIPRVGIAKVGYAEIGA